MNEVQVPEQNEAKMNWFSIWVAAIILFLVSLQYSIYLASLWPYMSMIDPSTDQTFYGITVAAYSVGSMVSSPIFGYINGRWKLARPVIALGVFFSILGNLIFMFVEASPSGRKWIILVARFMTGFGKGIVGPVRAYFAGASTPEHKSTAVAIGAAALSLGLTAGPVVQACVTPVGYPALVLGPLHVNEYTLPAYISNVAALILLLMLYTCFKESDVGIDKTKEVDPYHFVPKFDRLAATVCIFGWFTIFFCTTNAETVESPMTMAVFAWTNAEAVKYNSIIMSVSSLISFLIYVLYIFYGKRVNERVSICVGFVLLFAFYVITFPWPFFTGQLTFKSTTSAPSHVNTTTLSTIITSPGTTGAFSVSNTTQPYHDAGCDSYMEWCYYTPQLPLIAYLVAYPLMAIGLPASTVSVSTLFSKVLGPRQQGFMQGLMSTAGSFARLLGPILISFLFGTYGPRIAWVITSIVVAGCICSVLIFHHRLVPLNAKPKLSSGDKVQYDGGVLHHF